MDLPWQTGSPEFHLVYLTRTTPNADLIYPREQIRGLSDAWIYGFLCWDNTADAWCYSRFSGEDKKFTTPVFEQQRKHDIQLDGETYHGPDYPFLPTTLEWVMLP